MDGLLERLPVIARDQNGARPLALDLDRLARHRDLVDQAIEALSGLRGCQVLHSDNVRKSVRLVKAGEEFEWLTRRFAREPKRDIELYVTAGTLETVVTPTNRGHYQLATARHLRDVLEAKGYDYVYEEFVGVHDEMNWQSALADALRALLPPR
jgi:hypothetical protein